MSKEQIRYECLPWDSGFFGYRTGRIIIDHFEEDRLAAKIKSADAELLYIFDGTLSGEVDDFLLSEDAAKYDCKMKYEKLLALNCDFHLDQDIEFYKGSISDELEKLAYSSGKYSRFKKDKKLKAFFEPLYKRWILNAIEEEKRLLIIRKADRIVGFLSFSINGKNANINLFSVNRDYAGKGFGTRLYRVLECFLVKSGVTELMVVTQRENIGACHFYEKLGFKLVEQQNIYHLWR